MTKYLPLTENPTQAPVATGAPVMAHSEQQLSSLNEYLRAETTKLRDLAQGPLDTQAISEMGDLVMFLSQRSLEDAGMVSAAIAQAIGSIASVDHVRALNLTAAATDLTEDKGLEAKLARHWTKLMQHPQAVSEPEIFEVARRTFANAAKPALKIPAAEQVTALSWVAAQASNENLSLAKASLSDVHGYAVTRDLTDLAATTKDRMARVDLKIVVHARHSNELV